MRKLLIIAGVPIDDLSMAEALDRIEGFVQSGRPHQVATVNADFVVKVWNDSELRNILNNADMLTADGMPLVWGARLLGVNLRGRVTGSDLVPLLAERGALRGWRFFLLGGQPGVAERASEVLAERFPGFTVAGIYSPPFAPVVEMTPEINERIRAARPDVLLVAFGNPKQEKWIYMHLAELGVPVAIGIGASLDFVAGEVARAPVWMQNSGLEWLFRLGQEPKRLWKRYLVDMPHFARFFLIQWWRQLLGKTAKQTDFQVKQWAEPIPEIAEYTEIILQGPLTNTERAKVQAEIEKTFAAAPAGGEWKGVRLNMTGVTFIDSVGLGMLVNLTKQARSQQAGLILAGLRPEILTTIRLIKLDQFFTLQKAQQTEPARGPAVRELNGFLVLAVEERLETSSARSLPEQVEKAALKQVVLDFTATNFMDSAGVAAILNLQRKLISAGGSLTLAALSKDVRRTLELSGIMKQFHIVESVELAAVERKLNQDLLNNHQEANK